MSKIQDKFNLTGKSAIVTGGIGLLGKEFCRTLAEAGAFVLVADIDQIKARQYAQELNSGGYKAEGCGVDVTSAESVQNMAAMATELTGHLDILVNSAAMDPNSMQIMPASRMAPSKISRWRCGVQHWMST
jgi:NAD(P)-dependent dehydrogenase (short-subunit alcohol dehydrogenase family)